ncbi:MAG: hypothetical protein PHW24_04880, partial [Candidatus Moranbacteria bacterium]|nr:hypothetical protein [Candidatus Moranbacteria bacterium]
FGVKGKEPINEKGNLALFSPTKKVFIDNPVGFNTQLANTGNFPFKISGTVDIFKFGKHMATLDMVPHLLYPDRVRSIEDLNWDFSLLDIGKYEAKLNLTSEDGSVVIAGTTTFFVIPWKLVAIVFFSLLILWIIFSAGRMSGKNNSTNNNGKK